jgi:hypothetical protein
MNERKNNLCTRTFFFNSNLQKKKKRKIEKKKDLNSYNS